MSAMVQWSDNHPLTIGTNMEVANLDKNLTVDKLSTCSLTICSFFTSEATKTGSKTKVCLLVA